MATELVRRLDCAVLAMRYSVVDDFAIALAGSFYSLVLGKGQSVARALGLSLPGLVADPPTAAAPALSVGTPALFGARAGELKLAPPPGGPVVFQAEAQKLAGFLPQPERFVGRVGPMTRATAALAPRSGRTGVLFHGMAGAGKSACALELAYTHEQSFTPLVWHQAPPDGHDITGALTALALDLEGKLPDLRMAHVVDDTAALVAFLPTLKEFLRRQRVLVVLDNLESLLTADGQWRDPRWEPVIDALTWHSGLSRVVLTSRVRPARADAALLVEPVHALSLNETVLLAREWPHLRALLDATKPGLTGDQARALAARTLAVVQGHPKLIELADGQAADPTALTARLDEADRTWLATGTRLEEFLHQGEPTGSDEDYLRVLDGWTRGATAALPEDAATVFAFLCCLEEGDRIGPIVEDNWADLWHRLGKPGQPPDPGLALVPLVDRALVAVDRDRDTGRPRHFGLHSAVAESGRTGAGRDVTTAVDTELAAYWLGVLDHGLTRENEEMGPLILRAARAATPYLLRQHQWEKALRAVEHVLMRDRSSDTAAAMLPMLRAAADATRGNDLEVFAGRTYATAVAILRPDEAETRLRQLLDITIAQQQYGMASTVVRDIVNLCKDSGRINEALALIELNGDYTRRAEFGPWTQLANEAHRLQILVGQGHAEQVLTAVEQHRAAMKNLPESSDQPETMQPWNVRETVLAAGRTAAAELGRWQLALDLNAEWVESMRRRGATDANMAKAASNDYGALLGLGRTVEARELLQQCLTVFQGQNDVGMMGKALGALADVEEKLGHADRAIQLQKDALRLMYIGRDPAVAQAAHNGLAVYLSRHGGDVQQEWAHRLAAAIISYQAGSGSLTQYVSRLAWSFAMSAESAVPTSFCEVCRIVDQVEGVHLVDLVTALSPRAPDGQAAMTEVLRLAREHEFRTRQRHLDEWEPVIAGLVAANRGDQAAAEAVDHALAARGEQPDWTHLVAVQRRIRAGDRDPALAIGLDWIDTAIVRRTLDALTGEAPIDPKAWRALTTPTDQEQNQWLTDLVRTTVAAATGDPDAATGLQTVLEDLTASPDWTTLAAVLRRILAGDRDPGLLDGLDATDTAVVTDVLTQLNEDRTIDLTATQTPQASQ